MTALPPFQTLLDEHAADVMSVLRGAVGRNDAEDCFQETFIAALRAYPELGDARNLRGWLLTIAHRKAIDCHRANGKRPLPVGASDDLASAGVDAREGDDGSAMGAVLDSAGTGLWPLVAGLPPKQRAAVALRFGSDLPHAEIAAALGCTPAAARRSLHEGIKRLRTELGAAGPDRRRESS